MSQGSASSSTEQALPGFAGRVHAFASAVAEVCNWLAAISIACIVVINGVNVVGRYFFGSPLAWSEELMLFLMILAVFSGAVTVTWRQSHIRIEALLMRLTGRERRVVSTCVGLLTIAAAVTLTVQGGDVVALLFEFGQKTDALEAPMWIPQAVIPAGMFLIACLASIRLFLYQPETPAHLGED